MKNEYSFKNGKRGAVLKEPPPLESGKLRITIRLDEDIVDRFFEMADATGNGYETLINAALRKYLDAAPPLS